MWEEVQLSPWGGGHQDKRQVSHWQFEEGGKEEESDTPWGKRGEKTGEWTFSKKEEDGKEASWGTDKELASEQEVGEEDRGGRERKAANQANILNILSQLISEANEDKEDEEKEERQNRYLQSSKPSNSSFCRSITKALHLVQRGSAE